LIYHALFYLCSSILEPSWPKFHPEVSSSLTRSCLGNSWEPKGRHDLLLLQEYVFVVRLYISLSFIAFVYASLHAKIRYALMQNHKNSIKSMATGELPYSITHGKPVAAVASTSECTRQACRDGASPYHGCSHRHHGCSHRHHGCSHRHCR
jgi:hypothetical protein